MSNRYRTIVADPPWDHSDGTGWNAGTRDPRGLSGTGAARQTGVPYPVMTVAAITGLPVADLADPDAHLYLWTTNRYLRDSYDVARAWGFEPVKPIVWCKTPNAAFIGGTFGGASVEFCLYAKRGNAKALARAGRQWFEWPRSSQGGLDRSRRRVHSAKPEAFLDLVESVSPGPYLEMFARRARFGWDYYGDESLGTAELSA